MFWDWFNSMYGKITSWTFAILCFIFLTLFCLGFFWVSEPGDLEKYYRSCDDIWHVFSLRRVNYDLLWRHNDVRNQPFEFWDRHLEFRACCHTADNDDIEKYIKFFYEIYLIKTSAQKDSILLLTKRKNWKKTENSQNTLMSRELLWKRQSS